MAFASKPWTTRVGLPSSLSHRETVPPVCSNGNAKANSPSPCQTNPAFLLRAMAHTNSIHKRKTHSMQAALPKSFLTRTIMERVTKSKWNPNKIGCLSRWVGSNGKSASLVWAKSCSTSTIRAGVPTLRSTQTSSLRMKRTSTMMRLTIRVASSASGLLISKWCPRSPSTLSSPEPAANYSPLAVRTGLPLALASQTKWGRGVELASFRCQEGGILKFTTS